MFGATKLFPWFVHILGFHGTFWMYGLVMLVEVGCFLDNSIDLFYTMY